MTKKISGWLSMIGVAAMLVWGSGCATTGITLDDLCANCVHEDYCDCHAGARCNPKCLCNPGYNCISVSQAVHETQLLGNWNAVNLPDGVESSLQFLPNQQVAGRAGVNSFDTSYTFSGRSKIRFNPLRLTKMFGADKAMQYEEGFVKKMESVTGFKVDDEKLDLYSGTDVVLSFKR